MESPYKPLPRVAPPLLVDVGCGSSAMGLEIAAELPRSRLVLLDASPAVLGKLKERYSVPHEVSKPDDLAPKAVQQSGGTQDEPGSVRGAVDRSHSSKLVNPASHATSGLFGDNSVPPSRGGFAQAGGPKEGWEVISDPLCIQHSCWMQLAGGSCSADLALVVGDCRQLPLQEGCADVVIDKEATEFSTAPTWIFLNFCKGQGIFWDTRTSKIS
eukprot:gene25038-10685_t